MSQASLAQRTRTLVRATESKTALDQLIRVARKERKVDPTVWQYPNFLTRLFTSPCAKIGNCCLDHKEWYEDPVGSVLILAPIFLFIAALVTGGALDHQVDSTLLGFWDIFRWVLGSVVSIVGFSTLPIISKRQLERWEQHKSDLANKRQELERLKPEEFLVPYLQTELAKVREAVLGEQAPLRTFGDALRLRHERLLALDKELMAQINLAPSMAFALRSDQKANQEAIAKLEQKETRVQDLIARTTAYYNLIDERINGISPLLQARRLHERAVAEIGATKELIAQADDVMDRALDDIRIRTVGFQELASTATREAAEHVLRSADSQNFDAACEACDQVFENGLEGLPPFDPNKA